MFASAVVSKSKSGWVERVAVGAALLSLTGGCGELELPPPPDMSELVEAYNAPDGDLDASVAVEFGKTLFDTLRENRRASGIEIANSVVQNLQDLGGGAEGDDDPENTGAGTQQVGSSRFDLAAIARVHRICRGWEGGPVNEAENGSLDLTATLDQGGLIPTVWGTINHCKFPWNDFDFELEGEVKLHFGSGEPRVGLRRLGAVGYLFQFDGTVLATKDGQTSELTLNSHFKAFLNGKVLMLFELSDGAHVIGMFDPESLTIRGRATTSVSILGKSDTWECTLVNADGTGSCSANNSPVISW
jgi:hypothetical protein